MNRRSALMLTLGLFTTLSTARAKDWNGYEQVDFKIGDNAAFIVKPKTPAPGNPWIWRTEFFGHEPQADLALLAAGWHVGYVKVSDIYGAPPSIEIMAKYHAHVVKEFGVNQRTVLEGFSRGGLYAVNYAAAHPDHVKALYLDAPVLDIRSWPGGKGKGKGNAQCWAQALQIYGLTEDTAKTFAGNPLDYAEKVAKAGIAVIAVVGDADDVVPLPENTAIFAEKFRAAGGVIEVVNKPGIGHHPHSLKDPKPIVDFLLKHSAK